MQHASPSRIEEHLRFLTEEIGVRLAGSPGERRAADYVGEQFAAAGARVLMETFPVRERRVEKEELEILMDGDWRGFACSLFSNTPGTGGQPVEAELYFFESPAAYRNPDLSHLRGKGVVHLGCHIESRDQYRRLLAAEPAFLLAVDIRYPADVPLADGMFPAYTEAVGAVPTINVAYMDAWEWKQRGATRARLRVTGGMRPGTSQNVIADLPGQSLDVMVVGGHHDTQAASVGADDNGSGVAALLELARLLGHKRRKRGIRLISFGAEEQLSVGSAAYVRRHRAELGSVPFMFNVDSFGSLLGWNELTCNGPEEMVRAVVQPFEARGHWVQPTSRVMPYADHFPFLAAGIPAAFLSRNNCTAGRFFHHRPDDDLSRVSTHLMAGLVDAGAALLSDLAEVDPFPFPRRIPSEQAAQTQRVWEDLFGGWR